MTVSAGAREPGTSCRSSRFAIALSTIASVPAPFCGRLHGKNADVDIQYPGDQPAQISTSNLTNGKEVPNNRMSNSNSSSNPTSSRVTLKLKVAARKSARECKTPPLPLAHSKANGKPGAHWSDEYKERMQTDMDRRRR
jgi:hypothetical protein